MSCFIPIVIVYPCREVFVDICNEANARRSVNLMNIGSLRFFVFYLRIFIIIIAILFISITNWCIFVLQLQRCEKF